MLSSAVQREPHPPAVLAQPQHSSPAPAPPGCGVRTRRRPGDDDALGKRLAGAVLQRMRDDAFAYSQTNGLVGVGNPTFVSVTDYVNDTDNPSVHRRGLLQAWNTDRPESNKLYVTAPTDLHTNANANPFHYSTWDPYRSFTTATTGLDIPLFGSTVSAFYNRGAPKIGSQAKNWGKAALGDSYVEFIRGVRSGGLDDDEIATALLNFDEAEFTSHLERRAAAMLTSTVYLAEEWRKQGAAKIYRAILRRIADQKATFDDFLDEFEFIASADAGRRQVGRFYDMFAQPGSTLKGADKRNYTYVSDEEDDDYSSDEDTRDNKSSIKKRRLYAHKHMPKKKKQRTQ